MSEIIGRVEKVFDNSTGEDINDWERGFLNSIKRRSALSEKQEACLKKIEVKVGIEDQEEPGYQPLDGNIRF